jgi:ABC-2 type transport system ATP-binding protein
VSAGPMAELDGVARRFGEAVALDGVNLRVEGGEIVALLGPNGAGKTTALRILLGLRRPDRGRARLFGLDPRRIEGRLRLGCTPQETGLPPTLTVRETVELVRAHFPRPVPTDALLDRFALAGRSDRQNGGLSGGQRRRLAVALAFAGAPDLVVLDEPSAGLDVAARRLVWEQVRSHAASGGAVLLTTHQLEEADALATRAAVIARGRIRFDGTVAEIRARTGLTRVRLATDAIPYVPGVVRREHGERSTILYVTDAAAAIRELVARDTPLEGLEISPASLEDALVVLGAVG